MVLHASSVSRHHARLECEGEDWFLRDLDSSNGVFMGGRRSVLLELTDGALFELGDLELRFRLEPVEFTIEAPQSIAPEVIEFVDSAPDLAGGVEIELENEAALDAPLPSGATPIVAPIRQPQTREPAAEKPTAAAEKRRAAALARASRGSAPSEAGSSALGDRPALRYSQEVSRSGFFAADLQQYPVWVRALAATLALAFFGAVFWLAFSAVGALK